MGGGIGREAVLGNGREAVLGGTTVILNIAEL